MSVAARDFRPRGRLTCERIDQHDVRRLFNAWMNALRASKRLNAKVQVGATGPAIGFRRTCGQPLSGSGCPPLVVRARTRTGTVSLDGDWPFPGRPTIWWV